MAPGLTGITVDTMEDITAVTMETRKPPAFITSSINRRMTALLRSSVSAACAMTSASFGKRTPTGHTA